MTSTPAPDGSPAVRYTHGHGPAVLAGHSRRTATDSAAYLLPRLRAGLDLLDVGCGPATITADLAGAVKEAGGPAIDRRKIEVIPPIKSTGRHSATVRLHADVVAPIEVNVVARRR